MAFQREEYTFDIDGPWEAFLDQHGFCVVKQVASAEDVQTSTTEFWECFERLMPGLVRGDLQTWASWKVDQRGIVLIGDVLQSPAAWHIRGLPRAKQVFSQIWKDEDLIVSMDSTLMWLPWWERAGWKPRTEGLHLDQNPFSKPAKCCVQGMLPLMDVAPETGGLQVVPDSHTDAAKQEQKARNRHWNGCGDFCLLMGRDPAYKQTLLVLANAGDLILWDSRTIHGGFVGSGKERTGTPQLARLAQTVCMVPRRWASDEVLTWRRHAFESGFGTTHWPQEGNRSCPARPGYQPIQLTPAQQSLL